MRVKERRKEETQQATRHEAEELYIESHHVDRSGDWTLGKWAWWA